jgi:hypothetical protein
LLNSDQFPSPYRLKPEEFGDSSLTSMGGEKSKQYAAI